MKPLTALFAASVTISIISVGNVAGDGVEDLPSWESIDQMAEAIIARGVGSAARLSRDTEDKSPFQFDHDEIKRVLCDMRRLEGFYELFMSLLNGVKDKHLKPCNAVGFIEHMSLITKDKPFHAHLKIFEAILDVYGILVYKEVYGPSEKDLQSLIQTVLDAYLSVYDDNSHSGEHFISEKLALHVAKHIRSPGNEEKCLTDLLLNLLWNKDILAEIKGWVPGAEFPGPYLPMPYIKELVNIGEDSKRSFKTCFGRR